MRMLGMAMLMLTVSGCATVPSDGAICAAIERDVDRHTAALAEDGGDKSVSTGRALIAKLDAGCVWG
jgi:porphobilinogen deaminase